MERNLVKLYNEICFFKFEMKYELEDVKKEVGDVMDLWKKVKEKFGRLLKILSI